ncbi:LIC_13387 family protein [Brumimicrobium mesophilum]|uniref:LIC_13387 family protein n=1 Tax=Brumimicrobium mesophilum TaxID=392717 RepID=UPI000D143E2E|nr:hypothetical protein [Brumimicrobium mesophilum]
MKTALASYKTASWSLILVGIGHTLTDLTSPKTEEQINFILQMKNFTFEILGSENSIYSFHQGYSLMMGLLLFGYGLINLMISKNNQQKEIPKNILVLNIVISLTSLLLSVNYFFFVPIILISLALIGFSVSLLLNFKHK